MRNFQFNGELMTFFFLRCVHNFFHVQQQLATRCLGRSDFHWPQWLHGNGRLSSLVTNICLFTIRTSCSIQDLVLNVVAELQQQSLLHKHAFRAAAPHAGSVDATRAWFARERGREKKSEATIARWTARGKAHMLLFRVDRSLHFWFLVITVCAAAQNILSEAAAGSWGITRHPLSAARRLALVSPFCNPLFSLTFIQALSSD